MSDAIDHALASEDPEVRRRAVAALERDDESTRGAKLMTALGDTDWRVRKEAARLAIQVAESWGLLPDLVDAICQGENVGLRNAALEVLERLGPRASSALLVALPRVPDTARKFVVAALGFSGGAGVEKLAELSNDSDPNTAQAALEALANVGGARAEEALRQHLASADPVQRLAALEGLERKEARLTLAELRPLLEDRLVRRLAVRVLGFSDDPAAANALFLAMDEAGATVSTEAAIALGRVLDRGGPPAREVVELARDLKPETRLLLRSLAAVGRDAARRAATWILLLARDQEVLSTAAELAADDRLPPVALSAISAWGTDAVSPLLAISATLPSRARAAALSIASDLASAALPGLSPPVHDAVLGALRDAVASEDPVAVAAAAEAMAQWAEASDANALVSAAERFGDQVARAAGHALVCLAKREGASVEHVLKHVTFDGPLGAALLPAALEIGGAAATDRLQATLSADDARARRAAVLALPRLGAERALELAGFALADEDVDVQVAAVHVLAQLEDSAKKKLGAEHLRLALRALFEPVVAAAARALGAIGDRSSMAALRELLSDSRAGVAVAAMESLRMLDDPMLDDLLVEALGQTDEELVKEALRAIAQSSTVRRAARVALGLEHSAWDVRQLAAQLLGPLGGEGTREALEARLAREGDASVRDAIEEALERLSAEGGA